jgi:Uma2 family endonuclease
MSGIGAIAAKDRITPAEFLRLERRALERHEFHDGLVFAMAGGDPRHSRIKTNLITALGTRLRKNRCLPYDSDLRIGIPAAKVFTYPDASVICGPLEFHDEVEDTVTNPVILFEVLSPSSAAYDRGKKFSIYRQIPSLREYVLVSQDVPVVEQFVRQEDRSWMHLVSMEMKASIRLSSIDLELPLSDLYENVDFSGEGPIENLPPPWGPVLREVENEYYPAAPGTPS